MGSEATEVSLGERIREARTQRGLSLRALAADTGVSAAALSQLETGKASLATARLAHVASVLGVELDLEIAEDRSDEPMFQHWREFLPIAVDPVLAAALDVFVETGYHGSSIREVAERAGLSVAGIYHHYPSKQAMLAAIMDRGLEELVARSEAARDEGRDPLERICFLVEAIVLYHVHRQKLAFLGSSELRSLTPANLERHVVLRDREQRLVDVEVEAAVTEGQIDVPDPRDAARALVTMCTAVASWYRPHGRLQPEQVAERYVDYALRLIGPPARRRRRSS